MTNEMIERMAGDMYEDSEKRPMIDYNLLAKAALKAIQETHHIIPKDELIVLEEGTEPEVGDIVEWVTVECEDENYPILEYYNHNEAYGYKLKQIIQRNNTPVIYRGKE